MQVCRYGRNTNEVLPPITQTSFARISQHYLPFIFLRIIPESDDEAPASAAAAVPIAQIPLGDFRIYLNYNMKIYWLV